MTADRPELKVDPARLALWDTSIYVRARTPSGDVASVDIAQLDRASLLQWLRSRGGDNPWAENTVLHLLDHPVTEGGGPYKLKQPASEE